MDSRNRSNKDHRQQLSGISSPQKGSQGRDRLQPTPDPKTRENESDDEADLLLKLKDVLTASNPDAPGSDPTIMDESVSEALASAGEILDTQTRTSGGDLSPRCCAAYVNVFLNVFAHVIPRVGGDFDKAKVWMNTASAEFNNQTPIEHILSSIPLIEMERKLQETQTPVSELRVPGNMLIV